jgi:hypothetical protein
LSVIASPEPAHVGLDAVEAVLAVHGVGGVAVVPHERVVAAPPFIGVVARVADDAVGAGAAAERVDARAALDEVGAAPVVMVSLPGPASTVVGSVTCRRAGDERVVALRTR